MARSPWELIDEAGGLEYGDGRRAVLAAALEQIDVAAEEDVEARAIAVAMLAQQDPGWVDAAVGLADRAGALGVPTDWVWPHVAEALARAGRWAELLRAAGAVRADLLDEQGLHWRAVRLTELAAAALLRLGRTGDGVAAATRVVAELAERGDADDLVPPLDLVRAALATGQRDVLAALAGAVELDAWFAPELVEQIGAAISR